jgi:(p)ppGpp synthase/HD superfamily hydrolase
MNSDDTATTLLVALQFAAWKHSKQRRKDSDGTPYINHPIAVAEMLSRVGKVTDMVTLQAAILHDTLEDTQTSVQELDDQFGRDVRFLVQELTDDKSLPKQERKRLQIVHTPNLSIRAKQIKIADKICNLNDMTITQPPDWPLQRKWEYLDWSERVVAGCRGSNSYLEQLFDIVLKKKRESFQLLFVQ